MLLFLLPLLFNPFGLLVSYLPACYLAIWPVIIQTVGRDTLITHALVLILFIMTCDITRQATIKLIGFDLISLPAGLALLILLTTDKGLLFLSLVRPLFNALLSVVEPISLLIETYLFMDIIKSFNRWISEKANSRDEDQHDLSSWEPPLSRKAVIARVVVILITVVSYIGVYMLIDESKSLLGYSGESEIPIHFNHAIAALVTLQLIALSATIYKEEGILSESAMIALLASVPIFIASWSFSHLKLTNTQSSSWSSYFPFSILASSSSSSAGSRGASEANLNHELDPLGAAFRQDHPFDLHRSGHHQRALDDEDNHYRLAAGLEETLLRLELLDAPRRQLLVGLFRRLIMIINSILGLSLDKLAKYYFGPDFWAILTGRLLCLGWWVSAGTRHQADQQRHNHNGGHARAFQGWRRWLPLSRRGLIKLLLVLAYTQMLIQQMDNRDELATVGQGQIGTTSGCCNQDAQDTFEDPAKEQKSDMVAWFECVWSNAKACSSSKINQDQQGSRAWRLATWFIELFQSWLELASRALTWLRSRLLGSHLLFLSLYTLWVARWRSIIVQRLVQSMLLQLLYIGRLLFCSSHQEAA